MASSPSLKPPVALLLRWNHGDASKVLNRINVPVEVSFVGLPLSDSVATFASPSSSLSSGSGGDGDLGSAGLSPEKFAVGTVGYEKVSAHKQTTVMCIRGLGDGSAKDIMPSHQKETIMFSLMRTKYCSRVRADLAETIKARGVS